MSVLPAIDRKFAVDESEDVARVWSNKLTSTIARQFADGSDQDGGFEKSIGSGWCDGRETAYIFARLMAVRCWADRLDLHPQPLDNAIRKAMAFLLRRQHPDGSLDLQGGFTSNEAGFPLPGLVEGYVRLKQQVPSLLAEIEIPLRTFLLRAADAVLRGDAFTANHRWAAVGAPLAAVHSLWPDERYLRKIESYLADGIDCDAQGVWYEERSPNYNAVANHGFIEMAHHLKRPELLEPVIRNLKFTLFTLQPNNEADASTSHRQDRGCAGRFPCAYGHARLVALLTGDGRFTTLARLSSIAENLAFDPMPLLFELDRHPGPMPDPLPLPDRYDIDIDSLHASRFRAGPTALTLSADPGGHFFDSVRDNWGGVRRSDEWFHLHHGDVVLQSIQLSVSNGLNIQPAQLTRIDAGDWRLGGRDPGWTHPLHFRPSRPQLQMGGEMHHDIAVRATGKEISIALHCQSEHAAIAALHLYLRPGITFQEGDGPIMPLTEQTKHHLKGGLPLTLRSSENMIRIRNLPVAVHQMDLAIPPAIPSAVPSTCGRLSIGLRMPVTTTCELELL
jgi:hypothetical protein